MALGNEVENIADLLEKTTVNELNVVRLADKGRKLDTAEDGRYTIKHDRLKLLYKMSKHFVYSYLFISCILPSHFNRKI